MVDISAPKYYNWIRYLKTYYLKKKGMIKMKFNEKLIKLRKMAGLSQEELGNKLNVARQTISKWELGETTPEMDKLVKLSEIFNITLDELIKDENDNQKDINIELNNTNSQKLAGMVIKILKGLGIFLIILLVITIFLMIIGLVSFNKISTNDSDTIVVEVQEETDTETNKNIY